jgi:hypothetical protein
LLTDPPRVPAGVTAVFVYYIGLAVHGDLGWTVIKSAGEVELLGTVNFAQTLSSANLPGGSYDSIKFAVASAQVTYQGTNHTAVVQGGDLVVRIDGGAVVSSSQAAAALIEIQPTVINVGTMSSPQFVLWATVRGFPLPQSQVTGNVETEGNRLSLAGMTWWSDDEAKSLVSVQISAASLSANSLGLTVKDQGTADTQLKLVIISTAGPLQITPEAQAVPPTMTGSGVFLVLNNGTLEEFLPIGVHPPGPPVVGESQLSIYDGLLRAGYNLTGGNSVNLSYSGNIELSFGIFTVPQGVVAGSTYWITVIGSNTVAVTSVTAT